jgi:hypothetical protein
MHLRSTVTAFVALDDEEIDAFHDLAVATDDEAFRDAAHESSALRATDLKQWRRD